jgi:RNase P/RNase MRP subunit p29
MSPNSKEFRVGNILGKKIIILKSTNKFNTDKTGIIVNESKNMIYLSNKEKVADIKKIPKQDIEVLKVISGSGDYFINGKTLLGRPEDKISKIK